MPVYEDKNAKNKSKRFYFNIYYTDENGKRKVIKKRGFGTKKEARDAEVEIKHQLSEGEYVKPNKTNFGQILKDWLDDKEGSVKRSTHGTYKKLTQHLIDNLGEMDVSKLTHRSFQDIINRYKRNGTLVAENIRKLITIARAVLNRAVEWGLVKKNVATKLELPAIEEREPTIWTMDEAWEFMRVAREHRNYAVHVLTLATGLRQGEVLGLRRSDVDFSNNTIKIEQTVSHDGKRFETPKTKKSKRIVSIDEQTMLVLRIQFNFILKEKSDADPETYQDFDLLFPTANGTRCTPRNLYREFSTIVKKAKLQHIRFHDLRHCHATYLLELDLHPKKVAERLGHADSRMMDRYSHVRADVNRQTADEFGKAFYSKKTVG